MRALGRIRSTGLFSRKETWAPKCCGELGEGQIGPIIWTAIWNQRFALFVRHVQVS